MDGDLKRISLALKLVAESLEDVAKMQSVSVRAPGTAEHIVDAIYRLFVAKPPGPLPAWFDDLERRVVSRLAQDGLTSRELAPMLGLRHDAARQYLSRRSIRLSEL